MKITNVEGSREEVIDRISEELTTRLLAQVLEPDFRPRFMAVGMALKGSTATLALAVVCQVMLACGDNLKSMVHVEPAEGEAWTPEETDDLRRDIVMEAASRVVSETMQIVPAVDTKLAEALATEEAKQKGEKAFLKLVGGCDLSDTKH